MWGTFEDEKLVIKFSKFETAVLVKLCGDDENRLMEFIESLLDDSLSGHTDGIHEEGT